MALPVPLTIDQALKIVVQALLGHSSTASLDAQVLLAHVLGLSRAQVVAHPHRQLSARQRAQLQEILHQLEKGVPLPYILGEWEFYDLTFTITPDVLIPRPETELLVEHALRWLQAHPPQRRMADVGIGSGCIAVTLAHRFPDLYVLGTDISFPALRVARQNARRHGVDERVDLLQTDLLPEPPPYLGRSQKFDLIVANLPYIPTRTLQGLVVSRHEPLVALDGGPDGLAVIRRFLSLAPRWLAPGGVLMMEIEASEGPAALALAYDAFGDMRVHLHQDLQGHDRLLVVQTL